MAVAGGSGKTGRVAHPGFQASPTLPGSREPEVVRQPAASHAPGPASWLPDMEDSVIRPIEQKRWQPRRRYGLCVALRTFPKMAAGARGRAGASGRGAAGLASAPEALGGRKVGLEEPTGPHGGRAGAGRVREGEGNAGVAGRTISEGRVGREARKDPAS